jgi:glycosyltransferase involved in cell wall biosynthesis
MYQLIRRVGRLAFRRTLRSFEQGQSRPWESQQKCLASILQRNSNTVFGRRFRFANIRTPEAFQERVPVTTYEKMASFYESISRGTPNVLFPDSVVSFLVTSGTSGQPKLVPLSRRGLAGFQRQDLIIFARMLMSSIRSDALSGHLLTFSAPEILPRRMGRYPVGYITGVIASRQPRFLNYLGRIHPRQAVLNMTDWRAKLYLTGFEAADKDIRVMFGMPSNILAFLRAFVSEVGPSLLSDSRTPGEVRRRLRMATRHGELQLGRLWPHMRFLIYGGVDVSPYLPYFRSQFPDLSTLATYWATEAPLGLEFFDQGINPAVDTVFFEFKPVDKGDRSEPLLLSEVKRHTSYRLLITAPGGFYRYDLGDLVSFSRLNPPTMEILGRAGTISSIAGERLLEQQLTHAVRGACEATDAIAATFCATPVASAQQTGYDIYVEFLRPPGDPARFAERLDSILRQENFGYDSERQARVISPARLIRVAPGSLEALFTKEHSVRGAGKVPVISEPSRLSGLAAP